VSCLPTPEKFKACRALIVLDLADARPPGIRKAGARWPDLPTRTNGPVRR